MQVTIHAAKTHLSKLIQAALAGEEVIIANGGKPVVKLVPLPCRPIPIGRSRGQAGAASGRVFRVTERGRIGRMGIAYGGGSARHTRFRPGEARAASSDGEGENAIEEADAVWVSAISFFEIAQTARLGKWPEVVGLANSPPKLHETQGGRIAPLDAEICVSAGSLPWPHRDPFDRLIAATALLRTMTLVSADAGSTKS